MSLAMKARQKVKKKGASKDKVFGCDLLEHLQSSGQEVPQVLRSCAEFVEEHGIVDGIYRLCGIASNVQKLRLEFDVERPPNLQKETYLQDVHCVSSLCKAYFRELPNPLLTYQLYDKFADAVAIQLEEQRLVKIREVLKDLPLPHYRTLEYLMRHLVHVASYSSQTNMHARNLAIVWAPNLLRSKDIEASGFNGTAAFMEVRIQSIVVEFILTHVEQLFGDVQPAGSEIEGGAIANSPSYNHEDYFRSLSYNIPSVLNQGDGPPQMRPYHTIIEISEHKRKGSVKTKKWKSIFNLGRSNHDSKRKINKQDDKDENMGKMSLRPAKSMDSLSSAPFAADEIRKRSPKTQLPIRRESFGLESNQDKSFTLSGSAGQPIPLDTRSQYNAEYEEEATAKSEPTTPKPGRSSVVEAPQGRSPKTTQSRAEKCVGVHISGPFSVTLPFHITSNLSRLTRGMECPSLGYPPTHHSSKEESPCAENIDIMQLRSLVYENDNEELLDTPEDVEPSKKTTWLSLDVQDTFSFLDNQDANQESSPSNTNKPAEDLCAEDIKSGYTASCFPVESEILDDDLRGVFMHEMIRAGMQVEEFSVEPPPDDLSTDDDSDQMYFIPTGCLDIEDQTRDLEDNSEEVYLSAYNDLSPLMQEMEFIDIEASALPANLSESQEANSQHPTCENSADEAEKIKSELQTFDTKEVTKQSASAMSVTMNASHGSVVTCEQHSGAGDDVIIETTESSGASCEPAAIDNITGSDLDCALHDSGSDLLPYVHSHSNDDKERGQTKEPSSAEPHFSRFPIQTQYDNDEQCPTSLYVEIDGLDIDLLKPKRTIESQEEYLLTAPHSLIQTVNSGDEIMHNASHMDNLIYSIQEHSIPSVTTLSTEVQNRTINGTYPDGSVSMRVATTFNRIHQTKSVPVVPPKPQFAKLPPALRSKIHVSPAVTTNQDTRLQISDNNSSVEAAESCTASLKKQKSSSWRSGGSVSFDTALAHTKEHKGPVRRMQTYCSGGSYEALDKTEHVLHLQKLSLKPTETRISRPVTCVIRPNSTEVLFTGNYPIHDAMRGSECSFSQEAQVSAQEHSLSNSLSLPRIGRRSSCEQDTCNVSMQQRRSLL